MSRAMDWLSMAVGFASATFIPASETGAQKCFIFTHRWAGDDTKASEKIEKDLKEFSLKLKKNLPFLIFQLPSKDPFLNCKRHKKNYHDCDTNHGAAQSPVL